jgi:hypothetical protein
MAGKNYKSIIFPWLIFLFLSCQSMPEAPNVSLTDVVILPLENNALVYFIVNAKEARSILNILPIVELNDNYTRQILDRTSFFAAALFPKESGRRFQIVAEGNYPRFQAAFAMTFNRNWKKRRTSSGFEYWYSPSNGISILLGNSYAYAAASQTNEPLEPFTPPPGVQIPEGFKEFSRNSPLSCWITNPSLLLNRMFEELSARSVKNLFFSLFPASEEQYETVIRLQFENPSHARAMAVILSLVSGFSFDVLVSAFLTNTPVVNGSAVDIKSAPLSENEIKTLLELFFDR